MTWEDGPDAPDADDGGRIKTARGVSRRAVAAAEARYVESSTKAFRHELGATVRSVSPFLVALLASDGQFIDDVAEKIEPGYGWPGRSRAPASGRRWLRGRHALRHVAAGLRRYVWPDPLLMHGASIDLSDYDCAKVHIVAHSLEVQARLKTVTFQTCFGLLRIDLGRLLPETLAIACVGRLVEEVVDHRSLRGSGWRIAAVEQQHGVSILVVETGSIAYRLPWAKPS